MEISQLKRDANYVLNAILQSPDGTLIAKQDLKITFPVAYEEKHLATISTDVYVVGIFGIIVDGFYASNTMLSRVRLFPTEIEKESIDEVEYYVLHFEKGSTIVENMNLVKENTIGYYVYNYLIAQGKVPWYMSAIELLNLFRDSNYYSGVNYGSNHVATELIAAMIMRRNDDINQYWRQSVENIDDVINQPPQYIPLRDVIYGARNTTAKLMGAYLNEGMKSAIMYPSENTESVEEILRQ